MYLVGVWSGVVSVSMSLSFSAFLAKINLEFYIAKTLIHYICASQYGVLHVHVR